MQDLSRAHPCKIDGVDTPCRFEQAEYHVSSAGLRIMAMLFRVEIAILPLKRASPAHNVIEVGVMLSAEVEVPAGFRQGIRPHDAAPQQLLDQDGPTAGEFLLAAFSKICTEGDADKTLEIALYHVSADK
jgi:hypothetical protein